MPSVPNAISPRALFWLWYERIPLEQRLSAARDFSRFVKIAELEASLYLPSPEAREVPTKA
jgi:hypothetical protein